ncbi:pyridoxamine 5'-phosphate oxidase family protein [Notoacmeibacter ruber]|uniref:Pyridoxamine 5'-phosphate oxidase n=1 Tax=Notoacmeibacter ruber TaxID=2670375 RepID=A0A3L7JBN8_9HYPH|nr:pyridoxamine 5'-phosphate oxidase family protein [Notoacmeibacter ruber]RLQ88046.1 pyridoxamine 5'-phosphate oxidase [Notoacmeibacter ruber]
MQPSTEPATDMDTVSDAEHRKKVVELVKQARSCMFGTYTREGLHHSRPMAAVSHEYGDELWFFTSAESRKIGEIEADPRVTLHYSDDDNKNWVSAVGRASIHNDRQKIEELWSEPVRTWFPDGTDDPRLRLIRVELETAEYWDSPSSAIVYGFGYLKAAVTGKQPSSGDNKQVKM